MEDFSVEYILLALYISPIHCVCRLRYLGGGTVGRELTFLFIEIERKIALEVKLSCLSTL